MFNPVRFFVLSFLVLSSSRLATGGAYAQETQPEVTLVVLGIAQDAGFPQAGCAKDCCAAAWTDLSLRRKVSCVGIIDHSTHQRWILDCTPDFPAQLRHLNTAFEELSPIGKSEPDSAQAETDSPPILDGIFLTHAHIGHYTGLVHLGREVMGTKDIPVYGMPRMNKFLRSNGPWSQLVTLKNIQLRSLEAGSPIRLNAHLSVTPLLVPHRDEFSETVGFLIEGPNKTALYLPDIDKWSKWDKSIESMIEQVDLAFIDGTFLANGEIPGRDMSLIPHPFINESINRFSALDETERNKVKFIHLNHTNPAMLPNSPARLTIQRSGLSVANEGDRHSL